MGVRQSGGVWEAEIPCLVRPPSAQVPPPNSKSAVLSHDSVTLWKPTYGNTSLGGRDILSLSYHNTCIRGPHHASQCRPVKVIKNNTKTRNSWKELICFIPSSSIHRHTASFSACGVYHMILQISLQVPFSTQVIISLAKSSFHILLVLIF